MILDRTLPPQPAPIPEVHFPDFDARTLPNGLPIYIVDRPEQPLANLVLYIRAGAYDDPLELQGRAALTADLITKGTTTHNSNELAEIIDQYGASIGASANWDAITISLTCLTKYLPELLKIFAEIVLEAAFPEEELERMRKQRISSLLQAESDPNFLADVVYSKVVFPNHPYGQLASGTRSSLARLSADDVRQFYRSFATPSNCFLVAAGDVNPDVLMPSLQRLFGEWPAREAPARQPVGQPSQLGMNIAAVEKSGAVQSAIRVGHLGIERSNPNFIRLHVLNMILGGYFNSRINQNLREKHGFTYGARSHFDGRMFAGPFVVSTEVSTGVTTRAIEEILSELHRISIERVTEKELAMAKNYVIGSFPLQIETPQQIASRIAAIVLYGLPRDYYRTYRSIVADLTAESLLEAAKYYLAPDRCSIVVSGELSALRSALTQFGVLEIYNAEGIPIEKELV